MGELAAVSSGATRSARNAGGVRLGDVRLPVDELRARARRAATGLQSLGIRDGAAVALLLRNDLPLFEATGAARLAGGCVVPLNWHLTAAEILPLLADSGARVLVAHADLIEALGEGLSRDVEVLAVPTPEPIAQAYGLNAGQCRAARGARLWSEWLEGHDPLDRPAEPPGTTMLYTSGTTGRPKGVRRTPLDDEAQARYYRVSAETFGIREGARVLMTGPLYHSAPYAYAHASLSLGCEVDLMTRFDPERMLATVEADRVTHMHLVPTMFVRLLRLPEADRARYAVSSIECAVHGAAPCPPEVKRAMIEWWGPVIREYYGSTEASLVTSVDSGPWLERPGTVGLPRPGARVEVHDEQGRPVAPGTVGEIYAALPSAPSFTYHRMPEARQAIERDGLVTNGDLGYLDDEGHLFVCDRKRDMVISGGVNIYPAEIEGALLAHPAVMDCAVFGIPHEEFGEALAAAVELRPDANVDAATLREFLRGRLAGFKLPSRIDFHRALPRQDNGKIYKRGLRDPFWQAAGRRI
jgi:long-chain acyl-CoA synthetase